MATNSTTANSRYFAYKNLLLISFIVLSLYTAIFPLHDLQTSMYRKDGLGYIGLLIKYIGMTISSLFFGKFFLTRIGPKYTICISMVGYLSFVLANIHGSWFTLVPAGFLFGVGTGLHWVSAPSYIKILATKYSEATGQLETDVFSRLYPLWFSSFKFSQIVGNVISSNIIKLPSKDFNQTMSNVTVCGPSLCPNTKLPARNVSITKSQLTTLVLVSVGFACVSITALVFLNRIKRTQTDQPKRQRFIFSFLKELRDVRMLMLSPLAIQTGLQCSFVYADFTKGFVTCYQGIDMIGWAMSAFGVLSVLSGILFSLVGKYTGPFYILATTSVVHVTVLLCLLKWDAIRNESFYPYLLCAGVLGACETAWRSQLPVVIRHIFPSQYNEYLSLAIFLQSLGFVLYFAFGPHLCVYVKIYIVIGGMFVGIVLFGIVYHRQNLKEDDICKQQEERNGELLVTANS